MAEVAETPFEDESVAGDETAVDAAIRAAGGDPRVAIRTLLVDLTEARALAASLSSLGYRRARQPLRRLP